LILEFATNKKKPFLSLNISDYTI